MQTNVIFTLLLALTSCMPNSATNMNTNNIMTYEKALGFCKIYATGKKIDYEKKMVIRETDRFRFDFNSIDMSYSAKDSVLIARACIASLSKKRDDFVSRIDEFNTKYINELNGGLLEFDTTAIVVDKYLPYRINIRMNFNDGHIEEKELNTKVIGILDAAIRFRKNHYLQIFEDLNSKIIK